MASNPPPEAVSVSQTFDLPPREAIRFLEGKGYQATVNWTEMWQADHTSTFTVAKVAKLDVLVSVRTSLEKAMADGTPYEQWLADLQPELERQGWWGRVQDAELTGTGRAVIIGPRRLRTIYDTNLRMARSTALWQRIQASKGLLPFLRYSAVMDRRTRPAHRRWHGVILPVDHPWWATHFPPNGWNCRCTVTQVNQRMMERRGWKVTATPPEDGPVRPFYRRGSSAPVFVPPGIDPGFGYNPGQARAEAIAVKAAQSLVQARSSGLDGAVPLALDDVLAELPAAQKPRATMNRLALLAAAGDVAGLGAALAELLGL